ncbi:hypothetical protein V8C86DRAFT_3006023 [Haematococcus lacustris]
MGQGQGWGGPQPPQGRSGGRGPPLPPPAAAQPPPHQLQGGAGGPRLGGAGGGPGPELVLAGAGLRELPEEVWRALPLLTRLDLSGNALGWLPDNALAAAQSLRCFKAVKAGLQAWPLPPPPACLPALQQLLLSGNAELRQLPAQALSCCAASLTELDLAGVPAAAALAPGCLASCSRVTSLDLSQTCLTALPPDTLQLGASLRILRLAGNKLTQLPPHLTRLTRLEELQLINNELGSLPPELGLMTSLRSLGLEGNPLRTIRRPILERGTQAVLAYLKDRLPA